MLVQILCGSLILYLLFGLWVERKDPSGQPVQGKDVLAYGVPGLVIFWVIGLSMDWLLGMLLLFFPLVVLLVFFWWIFR